MTKQVIKEVKDERRYTKSYFDALGHYTRWDILRLQIRGESDEPLAENLLPFKYEHHNFEELSEKCDIQMKKMNKLIESLNKKII